MEPSQVFLIILIAIGQCKSSDWRYAVHDDQFTTRRNVQLDYYGGGSLENWKVDSHLCTIADPSNANTQLKCKYPGIYTITATIDGAESSKSIRIREQPECYRWYMKTTFNSFNTHNQSVSQTGDYHGNIDASPDDYIETANIWIVDPERADPGELDHTATSPSTISKALTIQFKRMGERPIISFKSGGFYSAGSSSRIDEFDEDMGMWNVTLFIETFHQPKLKISGFWTAHYGCTVRNGIFLHPKLTFRVPPSDSGVKLITSAGDPKIVQDPCIGSTAIVMSSNGAYLTDDGFVTSSLLQMLPPDNPGDLDILIKEIRFTHSYMLILTGNKLHKVDRNTGQTSLVHDFSPDTPLGLRTRDLCYESVHAEIENDVVVVFTENEIFLSLGKDINFTPKTPDSSLFESGTTIKITDASFSPYPGRVNVAVTVTGGTNDLTAVVEYLWLGSTSWSLLTSETTADPNAAYNIYNLHGAVTTLLWWSGTSIRIVNDTVAEDVTLHDEEAMPDVGTQLSVAKGGMYVFGLSSGNLVFGKSTLTTAVKLSSGVLGSTPQSVWFDEDGTLYILTLDGSGKPTRRIYHLDNQIMSALTPSVKCPYIAMTNSVNNEQDRMWQNQDLGEELTLWNSIVYETNTSDTDPHIDLLIRDPESLLETTVNTDFVVTEKFTQETMSVTLKQKAANNPDNNILQTGYKDEAGTIGVQFKPTEGSLSCKQSHQMSYVSLGCLHTKSVRLNRSLYEIDSSCSSDQPPMSYTIESQQLMVVDGVTPVSDKQGVYDFAELGCPIRVKYTHKIIPKLVLYENETPIEEVKVNYIMWEKYGRSLSYNTSMLEIGCRKKAQSWAKMMAASPDANIEDVWGPQNYEDCFTNPGEISDAAADEMENLQYEVMNSTGSNALNFAAETDGIYIISLRVVDPKYSYCNLETRFGLEIYGADKAELSQTLLITLGVFLTCIIILLIVSYVHFRNNIYRNDEEDEVLFVPVDEEDLDDESSLESFVDESETEMVARKRR